MLLAARLQAIMKFIPSNPNGQFRHKSVLEPHPHCGEIKKKKVLLVVTQAFDPSTQKVERQVDV